MPGGGYLFSLLIFNDICSCNDQELQLIFCGWDLADGKESAPSLDEVTILLFLQDCPVSCASLADFMLRSEQGLEIIWDFLIMLLCYKKPGCNAVESSKQKDVHCYKHRRVILEKCIIIPL